MKIFIVTLLLIVVSCALATTQSPYVGEEKNEIKALSDAEVNGLLQGKGMGLAKAAELNRYPGPKHVLELAKQLQLTEQQIEQTNLAFVNMREKAIDLGKLVVEYEKGLDELFSSDKISKVNLDSLLLKIGETKAQLRGVHLHAHLEVKKILTRHQVMMYVELRGYTNASGEHKHSH